MADQSNLSIIWDQFREQRVAPLFKRYPGAYRAEVVETNDPLQWHRVRFKMPELHDDNLTPDQLPWADKAPWLGGKNAGSWAHPCIGDIVWILFEKNHAYGPVWVGFATETRMKRYPLHSVYTQSPLALKKDETADEKPQDFKMQYLPKDFRPMSYGTQDRYGQHDFVCSVGFFPIEHDVTPAPPGTDGVSMMAFNVGAKPQINAPDRKASIRQTKYGMMTIHSDVGYYWKRDPKKKDNFGEFAGDFDKDRPFEIKRYFYNLDLYNEKVPDSVNRDQRRLEHRTRAGHKFEMRDVGWAQEGGGRTLSADAGECKSRDQEYDDPRVLSKWTKTDERWVKLRSKGGHIMQFMDAGFHPEKDMFYKRLLKDEIGPDVDGEKDNNWTQRDSRQMRFATRWGVKLVLDDRNSDPMDAEGQETPRGVGFMMKTRRSWTQAPSTPRGFAMEAVDRDELNTMRLYSPKSKIFELNDRKDYAIICTDTKAEISEEWMKLKENEFALKIAMTEDPEKDTYHLKLDKANGYIRLKTASGGDNGRRPNEIDGLPPAEVGLNQGLEARDGRCGIDGPWTEINDMEHRGVWLSKRYKLGIWRAKQGTDAFIMINDGTNQIVIRNNAGKTQIFSLQDIEFISQQNIALKADGIISLKAGKTINMEAGGSAHAQLAAGKWQMDVDDFAPQHRGHLPGAAPGGGAQPRAGGPCTVLNPAPILQVKREPEDRAETCNEPFPAVPQSVIKGQ